MFVVLFTERAAVVWILLVYWYDAFAHYMVLSTSTRTVRCRRNCGAGEREGRSASGRVKPCACSGTQVLQRLKGLHPINY